MCSLQLSECLLLLEDEDDAGEATTPGCDKFGGGAICFCANISYSFILDSLIGGIAGVDGDMACVV